jgi:kinetochore protein Nuf2
LRLINAQQLDRQLQNASDKLLRQQEMGRDMRQRASQRVEQLKSEYVVRAKERSVWQKEREKLDVEQKELEAEIAGFVSRHEGEINDLLAEYWGMRRQAGEWQILSLHSPLLPFDV